MASWSRIALADLEHLSWTCCPAGTEAHNALVQTMRNLGVEPDIRFAIAEYPSQLAQIATGLTVALVPEMAQRMTPEGVCYVHTSSQLHREICVAWRTDDDSPATRALLTALADRVNAP